VSDHRSRALRDVLQSASASARQRGAEVIEERDILASILENSKSDAHLLARAIALDVTSFFPTESRGDTATSSGGPTELPYSRRARRLLEGAATEARLLGDGYLSTFHILLAGAVAGYLDGSLPAGTTPDSLRVIARQLEDRHLEA
jgi:ATP-dependent Clp protease ATP-binding subunit ClpA